MSESRLSIVVDSRDAERKAQDMTRSLEALENAGVRASASTNKLSSASEQQRRELDQLLGRIDPVVGKLGQLDKMEEQLRKHQKQGLLPKDDFDLYMKKIDQTRQSVGAFDEQLGKATRTAGQNRQALQQLPMQFNDIWVSLAAGQRPLTVLMQQGTQISDSFGGVGPALRESAKYALGLVNPFTVGAAAVATLGVAAYQGADEAEQFNKTLIMMGNRSGMTTGQLKILSQEMDNLAGVTQRRAAKALNEVAAAGDFTAQQLRNVTEVALMLQSATGQAVEETVKQFASIKEDPVEALIELDAQYGFLNESLYESVKALRDSGDEAGAASMVMEAFSDVMRDRASQIEDNLGWIEQAWRGVKIGASEAWDVMLGIGRETSGQNRIAELQKELQNLNSGWNPFGGGNGSERDRIEQEMQFLRFQESSNAFVTAQKKAQADQLRENIKLEQENDQIRKKHEDKEMRINALLEERATLAADETHDNSAYIAEIDRKIAAQRVDKEALKAQRDAQREAAKAQRESTKAAREHAQEIERHQKVVQSIYGDISDTGKAWAEYRENLIAIREPTSYLINPTLEMGAAIMGNAAALNEALRSADPYIKRLDELAKRYQDNGTEAEKLQRDINELSRGISETGDPTGELADALSNAQEEMAGLRGESTELTAAMESMIDRLDDGFVNLWENILGGGTSVFDALKQGAIQTGAEILHAMTTRSITTSLTSSLTGQGGAAGTGGFSLSDLSSLSSVRSLLGGNSIGQGFESAGNFLARQTGLGAARGGIYGSVAGNGYTSGFGANVATRGSGGIFSGAGNVSNLAMAGYGLGGSLLGGFATDALGFESGWESSLGSAAGAAIGTAILPGIGTGIGAALGSVVGGGLGSLFGSSREPFAKTWSGTRNADPVNFYRDYYRNTELGTFGILDKQKMDPEPLIKLVDTVQQVDNQLAGMLNDNQLSAVRDRFAEPTKYKGTDLSRVLVDRYSGAIDALADSSGEVTKKLLERIGAVNADNIEEQLDKVGRSLQLGALVESLTGNVREYADDVIEASSDLDSAFERIQSGAQNFAGVSDIADRLNLIFDDTAAGAVDAANGLTELLGGLSNLQSQAASYYQSYFSEEERRQKLIDDITPVIANFGLSVDSTTQQFRNVVQSLDQNTAAGRQAFAELMNVQDAFRQVALTAAQASQATAQRQLADMGGIDVISGSIDAYNKQIEAIQEMQSARTKQLNDEMRAVEELGNLVDSLMLSNQSILDPAERLREAQRQFAELQVRAERGDTDAVSQLQGASSTYLDAAASYYGQGSMQYAQIFGEVTTGVQGLERQFGASVRSLGSLESIQAQALREQERARSVLTSQLSEQIRMVNGLASLSDLFGALPANLANALSGIIPGIEDSNKAVGGSLNDRFGQASKKYLADNPDVAAAVQNGTFKSAYDHYLQYGQYESNRGGFPSFDTGAWKLDRDQLAMVHKDEAIVPARGGIADEFRSYASGQGNREVVAELRGLRDELAQLREENARIGSGAAGQRQQQIREQQKTAKNSRQPVKTI